ncbi:MAG: site-2 protease family protein [Nanoarchaeota archaeon]|nr:site-2 protease family protein [Nanoarchaeota archaeon]
MNYDLLALFAFFGVLYLFYLRNKEKFTVQGRILYMYKTKLGLNFMKSAAEKYPGLSWFMGWFGIVTGVAGMVFIFVYLIKATVEFVVTPLALPPLAPVLPGVAIPGVPTLSFLHWVLAIFIVAVLHEGAHGIQAIRNKIKLKSSGFAFLGPILLAFVEPDEKAMAKSNPSKQLSVFAAGPFINILSGFIFLAIFLFAIAPAYSSLYDIGGINVTNLTIDAPLANAGLAAPFLITSINSIRLDSPSALLDAGIEIEPGKEVIIETSKGEYTIKADADPNNSTRGIIGISNSEFIVQLKESRRWVAPLLPAIKWLNMLVMWLFIISIGVGLFNLLPLGPVDGGRIMFTLLFAIFKDEAKAKKAWGFFSAVCLVLIFINLLPWIIKLFSFIVAQVSWVVGLF